MWVKYTLDEDGTYVIKSVANQGRVKTDNQSGKAGVSAVYATLGTTNAAYGNAKSVYIAVKADTSVDTNGSIVDVNGVYTGIKNTNILTQDTTGLSGFATGLNTFYLYNSNGYVTYAVIVGEDDTNSDNTVYFTSGATGRYYDAETKEYYVTYNAIQGGEQIVLKVLDDEATKVNPTIGGLFKATFNKDGYVKDLASKGDSANMNTTANKAAGYTLTSGTEASPVTLTLKGATLWVTTKKAADNYVVIDDDCKIFVHTYNDDADEYVEYNTLESAIGALTTEKVDDKFVAYVAKVATICNKNTGYATTLIINELKVTGTPVTPVLSNAIEVKDVNLYDGTFTYTVESGKLVTPTTNDIYAVLANAGCTNITYDSNSSKWSYTMPNGVTVKDHTVKGTQVVDTPEGMTSTKVEDKTTGSDTTPARVVTCTLTDKTLTAAALKNFTKGVDKVVFWMNGNEMVVADNSKTTIADILKSDECTNFFALYDKTGALIEYVEFVNA